MFNVGSIQGYMKLDVSGWSRSMGAVNLSLSSLSRTLTRTGAVALGFVAVVEREFGKFDKAIRHATSVTLDLTGQQFEEMSTLALDASVQWNKAATETAQAFYFLGSAGLTATEQIQAFNDTVLLSRAMGSSLAVTVEGMVDIVRAFGLSFADSAIIADQLTKTVVSSNLMFQDLDQALSYVSSTARLTNNTLAETSAMLGVMANAGIKGSMAGTVLRRAMTNLMSPTAGMLSLMYELNLAVYDSAGVMKPFIDVIGEISDKLVGTSDAYRNMVFEELFGRRAIAGQITLFNYGSVALRKYANEIQNSGGVAKQVADTQMKAFTEVLGQLWREVQRLSIEFGEILAPAIERVSNSVKDSVKEIREYVQAHKDSILQTMKWVTITSLMAVILPPLALILLNFANQFISLTTSITKLGLSMIKALIPIGIALAPFAILLASLYVLRSTLNTDFWNDALEKKIKPFLSDMASGFTQTIAQILWEFSLIPRAINKTFDELTGFIGSWSKQVALLLEGIVMRDPGKIWESVQMGNDRLVNFVKDMVGKPFSPINELFGSKDERDADYAAYINDLTIFGQDILDADRAIRGKVMSTAVGGVVNTVGLAVDVAQEIWGDVVVQFKKDVAALTPVFDTLMETLSKLPSQAFGALPAALQAIINQMMGALNEIGNLVDIFKNKPASAMGIQVPGFVLSSEARAQMDAVEAELKARAERIASVVYKSTFMGKQWYIAMISHFETLATGTLQWADVFETALDSTQAAWSSTIENMMIEGGNMKDFLDSMFQGILRSFNKLVADIVAADLMRSIFGAGAKVKAGTPSLLFGSQSLFGTDFGMYDPIKDNLQGFRDFLLGMEFSNAQRNFNPVRDYSGIPDIGAFSSQKMAGGGATEINITNNGNPVGLRVTGRQFNGKKWIVNAVMDEINTNPTYAKGIRGR